MVLLDVIAACRSEDDPPEVPEPPPAEPEPPATLPSPSGVFVIHVAPSPRLDPSKPEDVEIEEGDLGDDSLTGFIVD